jgi:hypothetical protein
VVVVRLGSDGRWCAVDEFEAELVALGGGEVADPLVGTFEVVVGAEPVKEGLQLGQVNGWALVGEPLLERACGTARASRVSLGGTARS